MKTILIIIVLLLVIAGVYFFFIIKPKFGGDVSKYLRKNSSQFDTLKQKYVNPNEELLVKYEKNIDHIGLLKIFLFQKRQASPDKRMPQAKVDLKSFQKTSQGIHYVWLGHSSLLVNVDGVNILVDPVFSDSVSPVSLIMRRFQAPVLKLEELPDIDLILISHDHYDHLDMETIEFFAQKTQQPRFITPLGIGEHLKAWKIKPTQINEYDWWESISLDELGLDIICTPAQHFSGRKKPYENHTLWSSWVLKAHNTQKSIFFSGDSGYAGHFKEIGAKYGPFDLAFIENGQYNENWKPVHMMPEETVQASIDLGAKLFVPIHWGMFNLALHNWFDPVEQVLKNSNLSPERFITPQIGEVLELGKPHKSDRWWRKLLK